MLTLDVLYQINYNDQDNDNAPEKDNTEKTNVSCFSAEETWTEDLGFL